MNTDVSPFPSAQEFDTVEVCIYDSAPLLEAESCMAFDIESRLQSHQDRLVTLATKVAAIEGKLSVPEKVTHPILIALLSVLGLAIVGYWSWVGVKVVGLGEDVKVLSSLMLPSALSGASADPTNPANIELVSRVLTTAKEKNIPIQPQVIAQAGSRFIEAAKSDRRSWSAAVQLLNYRTTLNIVSIPPFPRGRCIAISPDSRGIVLHIDSSTLVNCTQELDHAEWKNVDFRDVTIIYHGGPTVLENVHFINCEFSLDLATPAQELGQSLLASNSVTIKLPTP